MKIERYIFKEIFSPFLIGLLLYTFVLMMNQLFLLARESIQREMPAILVLKLLGLEFPKTLVLTIPMAILFGILIGLGRLVSDSEIVAFHASGVTTTKIFKATLYVSILATLFSLAIYFFIVPASEFENRKTRNEIFLKSDIAKDIKNRVFYDKIEGITIYADEIKAGTKIMERVFIKQNETKEEPERVTLALKGVIAKNQETGSVQITLENGETHIYSKAEPNTYRINRFSHLVITLVNYQEMIKIFSGPPQKGIQDQSAQELYNEMIQAERTPNDPASQFRIRRVLAEMHQRVAIPFVSIAFCIVAFALAMMNVRGGKSGGFALSIMIIIIFWVVFMIGRDLALEGKISVWLGIWSGNIVMLMIGGFFYCVYRLRVIEKFGSIAIPFAKIFSPLMNLGKKTESTGKREHRNISKTSRRTRGFLNLIDRYVLITFLKMFLFIILTIYVIYIVVELKSIIDSVVERKLPLSIVFSYFKFFVPGLLKYIIPVSSMMAAMITITLLMKYSEVVAIKASGISVYRMVVPILIATLFLSAFFYLVQDYILPYTNQRALIIKDTIEGRKGVSYGALHGRWLYGEDRQIFNYKNYESPPSTLIGVSIYEIAGKDFRLKRRIHAEKCFWNGSAWEFENGWTRTFNGNIEYDKFETTAIPLKERSDYFETREKTFFGGSKIPEQMSYAELKDYINTLQNAGYDTTNLRVGINEKLSFPLTTLIMVIISIPFAFLAGKKGSLYGVGISLIIIIVYWAVFAISNALGLEGILPPFLSAWAPNIIFGLAGTWGIFNIRT